MFVLLAYRSRALHCSSLLLQFCQTGDYNTVKEWLTGVIAEAALHDESICQAVRLTRGHDDAVANDGESGDENEGGDLQLPNSPQWNAWLALLLALSCISPSPELQPYVFGHLYESAKSSVKSAGSRRRLAVAQRVVRVLQRRLREPSEATAHMQMRARREVPPSLTEFADAIALRDCSLPIAIGGDAVTGGALMQLFDGEFGNSFLFVCFVI